MSKYIKCQYIKTCSKPFFIEVYVDDCIMDIQSYMTIEEYLLCISDYIHDMYKVEYFEHH